MKLQDLFEEEERNVLSTMGKQKDPFPGNFYCNVKGLTSLEGAPSIVNGNFDCSTNKLKSLKDAPSKVSGDFDCDHNIELTSMEGAPTSVGGASFSCAYNNLASLKGCPDTVRGWFSCQNNKLTSLEGVPASIGDVFYCRDNYLTSLRGIHKQIKHIGNAAEFAGNPIKSHVLGLLKISGLKTVTLNNTQVQEIINRHLQGVRDIFACQEELIEAGFEEYAKL